MKIPNRTFLTPNISIFVNKLYRSFGDGTSKVYYYAGITINGVNLKIRTKRKDRAITLFKVLKKLTRRK